MGKTVNMCIFKRFLKKVGSEPWLMWLRGLSARLQVERLLVGFPVRAHAWDVGRVLVGGVRGN